MGACTVLREEFRLPKFGFYGFKSDRFCSSQWRIPLWLYMCYRLVVMLYAVFWLGYTTKDSGDGFLPWGAFLTNWTYTLLTIYLLAHFLAAVLFHLFASCARNDSTGGQDQSCCCCSRLSAVDHAMMFVEEGNSHSGYESIVSYGASPFTTRPSPRVRPAWYLCIVWVLFNTVSTGALMVTIVYFIFLFPSQADFQNIALEDVQVHLINSVIIVVEHFITGVPCRLLHIIYPFLYGLIYLLFSVFFWAGDHARVMYPDILDWNKPGPTVGYVFLIGFVIIPLPHAFFFLVYKAKMSVFQRC